MKPKEAFLPFLKLIGKDRKNILKQLLRYTKEADKKFRFKDKGYKMQFVDIDEIVTLNETIERYSFLNGTSRPTDIAFLMALCRKYKDCNYLEIGSWRGESLFNIAKVAKKCTSISLSEKEMIQMGMSERAAGMQRLFTRDVENVTHIEANSMTFDFAKLDEKFDVIFIDGDHTYEGVKSDTQNAFKLLRDENSVIVWHDCGRDYEGIRYEVVNAIFDGAPADKRNNIFRVSNTICGIYLNGKFGAYDSLEPQVPNKVFSMHIESKPLK